MEKYFVTYEQAVALKELGFDEPCFGVFYLIPETKKWESYRTMNASNSNNSNFAISRPLKSQGFEWFREKHRLEPNIIFREYYYEDGDKNVYEVNIESNINSDFCLNITPLEGFKSYEEAESACIDKLIELVKNK